MIAYVDGVWSASDEIVPVREIDGRAVGLAGRPVTDRVRAGFRCHVDAISSA